MNKAHYKKLEPFPFFVGFIPSEKVWDREMKRLGVRHEPYPTTDGAATYFTDDFGIGNVLVTTVEECFKEGNEFVAIKLLVHEAVHVFQRLCETIGEDTPSKEFQAYYIEYISDFLIKAFDKCRVKK